MKVIMISTDKKIFEEGSAVRERMAEYSALAEELHIIVFSRKAKSQKSKVEIAKNVWIYGTNSRSKFLYIFDAIRIGSSIIRNLKFDIGNCVVTTQDPFETGKVGVTLKNKFGIPLNIQIHTDFLSPYFRKESFRNFLRVKFAGFTLKHADSIRVVSERIRNSVIRNSKFAHLEPIISVLPIWIDKEKFKKPPVIDLYKKYPQFNFIALMASRLTKEKNITLGIDAFSIALQKDQRIGLIIVGSGKAESALRAYVRKKGIDKNVVFEPWSLDLHSYYKTANVFFLTSDYEGYGLTLAEAALSGSPIVTTDVGIAGSILRNNVEALVSAVRDTNGLAQNIIDLVRNPTLSANLSSAAFSRIQVALVDKEEHMKNYKSILETAIKP